MNDLQIQRDLFELIKTVTARVDVLSERVSMLQERLERLEAKDGLVLQDGLQEPVWYRNLRTRMMKELDGDTNA